MNRYIGMVLGAAIAVYSTTAMAGDAEKLKDLERAMSAPAANGAEAGKKIRTRAIVFDAEPAAQPAAEPASNAGAGDCSVVPPDAKLTVVDFTIQFKLGSAEIDNSSEKLLHEIAKILSLSNKCVIVEGHTDALGNADRNNVLSRERADSVVDYISAKAGVDKKRLVPVGKGSSEPLKDLDPRNPLNRRVVFKVVG